MYSNNTLCNHEFVQNFILNIKNIRKYYMKFSSRQVFLQLSDFVGMLHYKNLLQSDNAYNIYIIKPSILKNMKSK